MISLKLQERLRRPLLSFTQLIQRTNLVKHWYQFTGPINRYLIWQSPFFKSFAPDLVVDVGANTGEFIMHAQKAFPSRTILAFEPHPDALKSLQAQYGNDPGIHIQPVGLGSENTISTLYMSEFSPSSSIIKPAGDVTEVTIPIKRLDDYESYIKPGNRVLIKIDVEGYEMEVLKGGKNFLSKAHYLYLEARTTNAIGCSFDEIYQFLTGLGWSYVGAYDSLYSPEGELIYFDALFTRLS